MPGPFAFDPVLSGKASAVLVGLPKAKQRIVADLAFRLAEHPSQLGDYSTRESAGREIQHINLGDWHFSFWADHAARELRITEITEL
ncbi:MAG: hypothetical protein ABSA05_07575 [Opitutaceae bacterium]|jgi:hypothetical protein